MKPLCGSRGFAGVSACILRAGHEGPHQYGNFASAVLQDESEELERLRAELLRVTELETAIEVRDEDCERLRAENDELRERLDAICRLSALDKTQKPEDITADEARKEEQ
jgi:regulator of replication initiation timing